MYGNEKKTKNLLYLYIDSVMFLECSGGVILYK